MAEKLHHSPEQHKHTPEQHHHTPETHHHTPETHHHKENIAEIRRQAAHEAQSASDARIEDPHGNSHAPKEHFVNFELKNLSYQRTLTRVRKQLSPTGRVLSKVIHQPVVDAVSEGVAKTIGRPSGILGGGIVALAGTSAYYYISNHYGYDYNFGVFLLLMAVGFVAGWLAEYLIRTMHGSK